MRVFAAREAWCGDGMPTKRFFRQLDVFARRMARYVSAAGVLLCAAGLAGCHGSNARDEYYSARGATVMPQAGNGSALVAEPTDMFESLAMRHREVNEPSMAAVGSEDAR